MSSDPRLDFRYRLQVRTDIDQQMRLALREVEDIELRERLRDAWRELYSQAVFTCAALAQSGGVDHGA